MRNVTAWCSLFLNQLVFKKKNKFCNIKIHLFSILNTKQTNDGIFRTRVNFHLAKNFLKRESPTLSLNT